MAVAETTIAKVKDLIYNNQNLEAQKVLIEEGKLSEKEASKYIVRLALAKPREQKIQSGIPKAIPAMMLAIGVLLCGLSIYLAINKNKQLANSTEVTGVVVDFHYNDEMAAPIISYTVNGADYQYFSNTFSYPPAYEQNDEVTLYVAPDDPENAIPDSFFGKYLASIILGGIGFVFFFIAGVILVIGSAAKTDMDMSFFDSDDID